MAPDLAAVAPTAANLAAVRQAMYRGERSVQYADRVVTYRSVQELQIVEEAILRSLRRRGKQTLLVGRKGF